MDTNTYITWYTAGVIYGTFATVGAFLGYSFLAPWYKHPMGRLVWALFLAIALVLSVSFVRLIIGDYPFRREVALGTFILLDLVITACGYGIYKAQIKGYIKKKALEKQLKKAMKEKEKG